MSGLLGNSKKNSTTLTEYTQLDIQTSAQGLALTIMWGQATLAGNLIEVGNFQAIPQKSGGKKSSGAGGKGGIGGSTKGGSVSSYNYKADAIWALCEGPIQDIGLVYVNQQSLTFPTDLDSVPDTLFLGTASQAPWGFLSGHAYAYTAYVAGHDLDFGSTPAAPNCRWEIIGRFANSMPTYPDANPADIINDFLSNFQYGIGFGPAVGSAGSYIDQTSWDLYKLYTQAQKLLLSPVLDSQEQISQIIKRWADLTNTWIFWSGGLLKFVPLGDAVVTDGAVTYTPDNTAIFDLDYSHFIGEPGQLPVVETIIAPEDRPNTVKMEIRYRAGYYDAYPVEWKDQALSDEFGEVNAPVAPAHDICEPAIGAVVAQLLGQRAAYIARTFAFKLPWTFYWFEPGDIVTLTEPHIGLDRFPVRIQKMDEDARGRWSVVAEEFPAGIGSGTGSPVGVQPVQPGLTTSLIDQFVDPGNVNPPMVFEPQSIFTKGVAQMWIAASGGPDWGGANVFISFDGVNYDFIGPIITAARQGVLTATLPSHADPDTVDILSVDLTISQGTFTNNATHADADAGRTLCYVTDPFTTVIPCDGELIAYGNTTLTGTYQYDLDYLRRGQIGTLPASWASGSFFTRIDFSGTAGALSPSLLVYNLPAAYIDATLYLKFASFNRFGGAQQDISAVTAYTYIPCGHGFGTGPIGCPVAPTGLTATGQIGAIVLQWAANTPADNVASYNVYRASGLGASFGSAVLIANAGNALTYTDTPLPATSAWTYFITAINAVCESPPSIGADATVLVNANLKCRTLTSGASTTLSLTDDYLLIVAKTVGSATTVNGPAGAIPDGTRFEIIDAGNGGLGDSDYNPITFQPSGGALIAGLSNYVFQSRGGAFTVTYCTSEGQWLPS